MDVPGSTNSAGPAASCPGFSLGEVMDGIRAGQFEPYFQPKVELRTGYLVGAEAKARWLHPEHGVVNPASFMPVLEESGDIDELTSCLIERSAAACRTFRAHCDLTVSVSLSLSSLDSTSMAGQIAQAVRATELRAAHVILEVPEEALASHVSCAKENLEQLGDLGFHLSLDDYGAGNARMGQLREFGFSELRIGEGFVREVAGNPSVRNVVEVHIGTAHDLGLKCVAKGIAAQHDWGAMHGIGCDMGQGRFIAPPMDVAAFDTYAKSYSFVPQPPGPI